MTDIRIIVPTGVRQASGIDWPAQNAVSFLPAVRNRNKGGVRAEGRGFGMQTSGGNSQWNASEQTGVQPASLHVANNNDSGSGSLHEALVNTSGPRDIFMDVGGKFQVVGPNWVIADGEYTLHGETAPELVWIETNDRSIVATAGEAIYRHIAFWYTGTVPETGGNGAAFAVSSTSTAPTEFNFVMDHCFFGGGADTTFNIFQDVSNVTAIDCLVALPKGHISTQHAFGSQIGGSGASQDADFVCLNGTIFSMCDFRNPLTSIKTVAMYNVTVYNRGNGGFQFKGKNTADSIDQFLNCVGFYERPGVDTSSNGPVWFDEVGKLFGAGTEIYVNDTRAPQFDDVDEWSVTRETPSGANIESRFRVNSPTPTAEPDGIVAAPNRSVSEADYLTLVTQNNGPRPSERITLPNGAMVFLQDIYDDIINGTGSIQDDYAPPDITSTTDVFVPVANPHEESSTDPGLTNLQVQCLDLSEGFLV